MRLIDADALMEKEYFRLRDGDVLWSIPPSHIYIAPTIDAVPVVRCRECKHWGGVDEYGDGYCKNPDGIDNIAKENDFCSYGEKANK